MSTASRVPPGGMLINIQFLRFLAATLVVLYHASAHLRETQTPLGPLFALGDAVGFAGVDIFFVISGFIMVHTTRALSGARDASLFLRRRVARIYSGYWPFFIIALGILAWAIPTVVERANLYTSALLWPDNRLLLAVSWTLTFEMIFYLGFTALLLAPPRLHSRILWLASAALVAWTAYDVWIRDAYDVDQLGTIGLLESYLVSPFMLEFLAGSLLAFWLLERPTGPAWIWLLAGSALFLAGAWVNNQVYDGNFEQSYFLVERIALFGSASVMILMGLVRLEAAGRIAPDRFSRVTGGASYAIYLSHVLILTAAQKLGFNVALIGAPVWAVQAAFLALVAAILAYSVLHYRTVESALHRLFRRALGVDRHTGGSS